MLRKQKKLTKKEIKEDKLVTTYYKVVGSFEEYKDKLYIGLGVIALIIVAVIFYNTSQSDKNELANTELSRVIPLYHSGSYLEAIEGRAASKIRGLKSIVDEFGGVEYGQTAKIYLANSYFFLGKIDEALEAYKSYSGSNSLFKAAAYAGEAGCLEAKENYSNAADLFKKAANVSKENPLNADYLLRASVNFIRIGKQKEAKSLLETIKKDYTNSTAYREVDRYLALVN